jgi:hypothetical protein
LTDQREYHEAEVAEEFGVHPLRPVGRRRSVILPIAVATGLLATGIALALYLYWTYSDSLPSSTSPQAPASLTADTGVKLEDFRDFQQRANRSQQSTEQLLKAQQSEIVRLSDLLNLIAAKVDLLQRPTASVDDSSPSAPIRTAPARKKNPTSPRPSASDISVGGAPLPVR